MTPEKQQSTDPEDPRVPEAIWRLAGNRSPAPTISQYRAIRAGDSSAYQAANPGKSVVPSRVTKAAFADFDLNPVSTRNLRKSYKKALAKEKGKAQDQGLAARPNREGDEKGLAAKREDPKQEQSMDNRIAKLERKLARAKAKNKAFKAALLDPAAVTAAEGGSTSSSDGDE